MIRTALFALSCAAFAGLYAAGQATAAEPNLILAQWPGPPAPPPGPPGPPGPGWPGAPPGWPGPAPGPEWLAHQQQCEALTRHLAHLRHRVHRSPPWVREQLAPEVMQTEARLHGECWGP